MNKSDKQIINETIELIENSKNELSKDSVNKTEELLEFCYQAKKAIDKNYKGLNKAEKRKYKQFINDMKKINNIKED